MGRGVKAKAPYGAIVVILNGRIPA